VPLAEPAAREVAEPAAIAATEPQHWFYEVNGRRAGPASAEAVRELFSQGVISIDTLVWNKTFGQMVEATSRNESCSRGSRSAATAANDARQRYMANFWGRDSDVSRGPCGPSRFVVVGLLWISIAYYACAMVFC
jgi:GYF domain 2